MMHDLMRATKSKNLMITNMEREYVYDQLGGSSFVLLLSYIDVLPQ